MAELGYLIYLNFACTAINVLLFVEIIYQIVDIYYHSYTVTDLGYHYQPIQHRIQITRNKHLPIDSFPYIAALVAKDEIDEDYDLQCATVIVSLYYSMSDVRCKIMLEQYKKLYRKVRSGSAFWQYGSTLHDIVHIIGYENSHGRMKNAIAFIKVNPGFPQEQIIPVAGANFELRDGDVLHSSGWGETGKRALHTNSNSFEQLYFVTSYLTVNKCKFYKTNKKEFCTELPEGATDGCIYNFCGFTVYNNILVGLISDGAPICGSKPNQGFHTDLASLNNWIRKLSDTYQMEIDFRDKF